MNDPNSGWNFDAKYLYRYYDNYYNDYLIGIESGGYIERKTDTTGFVDIKLTYKLENALYNQYVLESTDYCKLYYRINNGNRIYLDEWNWNDIKPIEGVLQTTYLPALLEDTKYIYIGISNEGNKDFQNDKDWCYIWYISLEGMLVTDPPSISPTLTPTVLPTLFPTVSPSIAAIIQPLTIDTNVPSITPTFTPTIVPTKNPASKPTDSPSMTPTNNPTQNPTEIPTMQPSVMLTEYPTESPTILDIESTEMGDRIDSNSNSNTSNSLWIITIFMAGLVSMVFVVLCTYMVRGCVKNGSNITMITMTVNDHKPNGVIVSPSIYDGVYSNDAKTNNPGENELEGVNTTPGLQSIIDYNTVGDISSVSHEITPKGLTPNGLMDSIKQPYVSNNNSVSDDVLLSPPSINKNQISVKPQANTITSTNVEGNEAGNVMDNTNSSQ